MNITVSNIIPFEGQKPQTKSVGQGMVAITNAYEGTYDYFGEDLLTTEKGTQNPANHEAEPTTAEA